MKTLVVYYSLDGNTQMAAEYTAKKLEADILRLKPENEPPRNVLKFLVGGKSVIFNEKAELYRFKEDPAEYDLIILGSPVWAGKMTPAVREFVLEHPFENKKVGLIACSASGEADPMLTAIRGLIGGNEVVATVSLRNPKKNQAAIEAQLDKFCEECLK